jgi:hypothetical protein
MAITLPLSLSVPLHFQLAFMSSYLIKVIITFALKRQLTDVKNINEYEMWRTVLSVIFFHSFFKNPDHLEFPEHKRYKIMGQCIGYCFEILKSEGINSAACLVDRYEE